MSVQYGGGTADYAMLAGRTVPGQAYNVWYDESATLPVTGVTDRTGAPLPDDQPVSDSMGALKFNTPDDAVPVYLTAVGDPANQVVRLDPGAASERSAVATLTNKTLINPVISNPDITGLDKEDVGLGNVDNTSNATERAATATLTNKTLNSPVINTPSGLVKGDVGLGNVDNTSNATERAAVATLANKTLTSPVINTPTGLVKGDVGLGNVDNTSNATERAATATLDNKTLTTPTIASFTNAQHNHEAAAGGGVLTGAALGTSPALAGNPTTTTQAAGNNSTRIATTAFVEARVAGNTTLPMPGQVVCILRQTTTLTLSVSGTVYQMTWQTEDLDMLGGHSGSSTEYIPTVAGRYMVSGAVVFSSNVTGNRFVQVEKNDTVQDGTWLGAPALSGASTSVLIRPTVISCNGTTDKIEIAVQQTSGGSLTTNITAGQQSSLIVTYVGP